MHNTWLVAKREYLEQIRGKAFKITTILVPALFVMIIGIIYLAGKNSGTGKHLAIASNDLVLAEKVQQQLTGDKDAHTNVEVVAPATDADRQELRQRVIQKNLDGYLWLHTEPGKSQPESTYES